MTTDRSPVLARTIVELLPGTSHDTTHHANKYVEADHGRLQARLRPMRGLAAFDEFATALRTELSIPPTRRGVPGSEDAAAPFEAAHYCRLAQANSALERRPGEHLCHPHGITTRDSANFGVPNTED